jgi:hypothetical protein
MLAECGEQQREVKYDGIECTLCKGRYTTSTLFPEADVVAVADAATKGVSSS